MRASGNHLLAEFDQCAAELLNNESELRAVVSKGVTESGFGLIEVYSHKFDPIGVTVIAIVSESHVAIHTYPEAGHASIDIFTCSSDPKKALSLLNYLSEYLLPTHTRIVEVQRGDVLEFKRRGWIALASNDGIDISMQMGEKLYSGHTKYQKVEIVRNEHFGKMLVIDNDLQITESDAHLYNQQMIQPLLARAKTLDNVLVLGGGDGGVARELLNGSSAEITVVDIDREIVDLCKVHLPELSDGALDDSRVTLVYEEAREFLERDLRFDAVVYDLTMHPEAFICIPREDYLRELFSRLKTRLTKGAILSMQVASEFETDTQDLIRTLLLPEFPDLTFTKEYIPSFCGRWVFGSATVS